MKIAELRTHKRILLIGYGVEGQTTKEFLQKVHPEAVIDTADQKDGADYLEKQTQYDLAIRTPGVRKELITIPYTTATNIFFANVTKPVIGVTGSKGKSTTTALIHAILNEANMNTELVGNIGVPMLRPLLKNQGEIAYYVCELSSFQLDDILYSPHIAVITNLFPEHMDYHGTLEKYYDAKKNIVAHQKPNDFFVYNPRVPELVELAGSIPAKPVPFVEHGVSPATTLRGEHNQENIRAAATVASLLGIERTVVAEAVKNFTPLPHRLEIIGTFHQITFVDDAIATTPQATIAALNSFDHVGTLFLGGKDRGYHFESLMKMVHERNIPNLVFFPDSGPTMLAELKKQTQKLPNMLETSSMEEAVQFAYQHTPKNTVALLSCASPSYSLWKNFEEKGSEFQKYVKKHA